MCSLSMEYMTLDDELSLQIEDEQIIERHMMSVTSKDNELIIENQA